MRRLIVASSILLTACALGHSNDGSSWAQKLIAVERTFGEPRIQVLESYPPQFDVVLPRDMPTPGYRFEIDAIEVDPERGRIVARVTDVPPEGMVAQVITRTELRLSLGRLAPGRYVLEVHTRRGGTGEHRLVEALVLSAA